jgi:hypothetical protein
MNKQERIERDSVEGLIHREKIRHLFIIFFIIVFACSLQIGSLYQYNGLIVHTDCPVCKFLAMFTSHGETNVHPVITPDFAHMLFAQGNMLYFFVTSAAGLSNRAPPYSLLPTITT